MQLWVGKIKLLAGLIISLSFTVNVSVISVYEVFNLAHSHSQQEPAKLVKCMHHQKGCPKSCICPKLMEDEEHKHPYYQNFRKQVSYSSCENHPAQSELLSFPHVIDGQLSIQFRPCAARFEIWENAAVPIYISKTPFKVPIV